MRRELVPRDGDAFLPRDRVEHEEGLRAALGHRSPLFAQLLFRLARLQEELLEADALLLDARLEIGDQMLELVLDEDLGDLDLGARERVRDGLFGCGVPRLVKRRVGELVADTLAERG